MSVRMLITPVPEILAQVRKAYEDAAAKGLKEPLWAAIVRWEACRGTCVTIEELEPLRRADFEGRQ